MKNKETTPRSIEGDWDWRTIELNLPDDGWTILEEKPEGSHIWSFIGEQMFSKEGECLLRYAVGIEYDAQKLRLSLDGWQLDNAGEAEIRIQEHYRVEFPGQTEMYLYDLEDVEPGEEESLRLLLRKI